MSVRLGVSVRDHLNMERKALARGALKNAVDGEVVFRFNLDERIWHSVDAARRVHVESLGSTLAKQSATCLRHEFQLIDLVARKGSLRDGEVGM